MSKKIKINIPNKVKPNLIELFRSYLSHKYQDDITNCYVEDDDYINELWKQYYLGWGEEDDIDDSDVVFPMNSDIVSTNKKKSYNQVEREEQWFGKKGKSKSKHRRRKKAKLIPLNVPFDGEEEDYNFDDISLISPSYNAHEKEEKEIWFYPDYRDKDDKLEFNTLAEFKSYCSSNGYYLPNKVEDDIVWQYETHCCINPDVERMGYLEILADRSYGEMCYMACDEDEFY